MSTLYTEVSGSGPDLVLLHGWSMNLRVWDPLVRELTDAFRVIAVDLPGHGRSRWIPEAHAPAALAWCVRAALEPLSTHYSLLGWSLGGQIALDLAAATPAQIERLVLVSTTARFACAPDWPYGMEIAALDRMAARLGEDREQTIDDFLELQVRGSTLRATVLERLRSALHEHGSAQPEALVAGLAMLRHIDLRPLLPQVRTPALVIAGQHDRVTPPWGCRLLAGALPRSRFVELRRAAHAPFLSQTREFASYLREFLSSAEPL